MRQDGGVVAVGLNYYNQIDVDDWIDIISVAAGVEHTLGLKSDGSVVASGSNTYSIYDGRCDVFEWTDLRLPN